MGSTGQYRTPIPIVSHSSIDHRLLKVIRHGDYTLYSYTKAVTSIKMFKMFPELVLARGTIVHASNQWFLPFTKFFNLHEITDTIPEPPPVRVYEKLDGTLIIAAMTPDGLKLWTRGNLWVANPYVDGTYKILRRIGLLDTLEKLAENYNTLMFELVTGRQPTSTAHENLAKRGEGRLYLLAARDKNMRLVPPEDVDWPASKAKLIEMDNWGAVLRYVDTHSDQEGVVVWVDKEWYNSVAAWMPGDVLRLADPLLKLKNREYLLARGHLVSRRALLRAALQGKIDDVQPYVDNKTLDALERAYSIWVNRLYPALERLHGMYEAGDLHLNSLKLDPRLKRAIERPAEAVEVIVGIAPKKPEAWPGFLGRMARRLENIEQAARQDV